MAGRADRGAGEREALTIAGRTFSPPITIVGGRLSKVSIADSAGIVFRYRLLFERDGGDGSPLFYARASSDINWWMPAFVAGVGVQRAELAYREACHDHRIALRRAAQRIARRRRRRTDGAAQPLRRHRHRRDRPGRRCAERRGRESEFRTDASLNGHPDAIQFWDVAGIASRGIVIRDNAIDVAAQGIFVKSEGKGGFDRVAILRNEVATTYGNAILLSGARDSRIEGNRIRSRADRRNMAKLVIRDNAALTRWSTMRRADWSTPATSAR
ncbi:hypothetical protein AB5I41_17675 [Sphingomonas sp. MMS24-JH45]